MDLVTLCDGLLEAFERFDEATLPFGLYAINEAETGKRLRPQEWERIITPFLQVRGCRVSAVDENHYSLTRARFKTPNGRNVAVSLRRFSNIKVRKYGSRYHVDKHENRSARWQNIDLGSHVSGLWKKRSWSQERLNIEARILLFIGFDKAQRPFESEMTQLQQQENWEEKSVVYRTRNWNDKAERGFKVRLSLWARDAV